MRRLAHASVALLVALSLSCASPPSLERGDVRSFGAAGDGVADDTGAIQRAVDAGTGGIRFARGVYRITRPIEIRLERVGFTSISGDGTARILMAGPGPALRFTGTHEGTAAPDTVKSAVWSRERAPLVDGLEIVGAHPDARGVEATGTMQLTVTRVVIRDVLHGIHLSRRNRNVIISECHIYENRGAGIFYDEVNLHQSNITNCHVSYNGGGGIVVRGGDVRNIHIGTCDIEGNMNATGPPAANVLLDSTGGSIAEVAIVGCTIQHTHNAPESANIRIDGESTPRPFTEETRHGHVTIANNVISDAQFGIDIRNARSIAITGNTLWKSYTDGIRLVNCEAVVVGGNVLDRNPRYHYGDGSEARDGIVLVDSTDCTLSGNQIHGGGPRTAAIEITRCRRVNVTGCTVAHAEKAALRIVDSERCRVSDCMLGASSPEGIALEIRGGSGNRVSDTDFTGRALVPEDARRSE